MPICRRDTEISYMVTRLGFIFGCERKYRMLLNSQPSDAQLLLNSFHSLLDIWNNCLDDDMRKRIMIATQNLSDTSNLYPTCYTLKDIEPEPYAVHGGQFTEVYRGRFEGQVLCIKAIRLFQEDQVRHALKTLVKEVIVWEQAAIFNVLPVFGIFHLPSSPMARICFVSPWMENGDINTYLMKQSVAPRLRQFLRTYGPQSNVLIDNDGMACLADYGISSVLDDDILRWTSQSSFASVRWKAPELLQKTDTPAKYSKESDVYAMACVFYEIFTNTVPFADIPDEAVVKNVLKGAFPERPEPSSPSWKARGLKKVVWALMKSCWSQIPTQRPSSRDVVGKVTVSIPDALFDRRPPATSICCSNYAADFRQKMSLSELDRNGFLKIMNQLGKKHEPEDSDDDGDDDKDVPQAQPNHDQREGCVIM
ncbi:hypothetical protein H0H93_006556 [Arthromyces matolae]|nr:hypothetical protein H0H93_006556 [Arthromyces matolae]